MQALSFCLCASRFRCFAASLLTLLLVGAGGCRAADSTGVSVGRVFRSCGCATTAVVGWGSIPLQQVGAFGASRADPIPAGLSLVCPCCWVTLGLGSALPCPALIAAFRWKQMEKVRKRSITSCRCRCVDVDGFRVWKGREALPFS